MNKWYVSPMQELELRRRVLYKPEEIILFRNDITPRFMEELISRDSVVCWVYGSTGTGKSTVSLVLSEHRDKSFNADLVIFDNSSMTAKVANSQPGNSFVRDETVRDFGEGSNQLLATVQDLTETLRKRRNSFFLLSPVVKGVPFVHYYLEVLQSNVNLEKVSLAKAIKGGLDELRFKVGIWDRANNPLGFIVVKSKVNNTLYLDYEKKKDKFLDEMSKGLRKSGLDITAEARKLIDELDLNLYPRKADRLNFVKMSSNFTVGQCRSIHDELERIIRIENKEGGFF